MSKSTKAIPCIFLIVSGMLTFKNIWTENIVQGHKATFAVASFDGKCIKSINIIFTFFIFAKVWPVRTIVLHREKERQTDKHTHRDMDRAMAIGENAD